MSKATDLVYRVIPLPQSLRDAVQQARERTGQTNETFIAAAVTAHLQRLIDALLALGFGDIQGKRHPVRLPFSDSAGTLDALREASDNLQVPAVQLLLLCLAAAASGPRSQCKSRSSRKTKNPRPD